MTDYFMLDLYDVLDIKSDAVELEIKKAYRKKALICHPDKNPGDPKAIEAFKQLGKAVEILTNKTQRAKYDKILDERKASNARRVRIKNIRDQKADIRKTPKESWFSPANPFFQSKVPKKPCPSWPPSASKTHSSRKVWPESNIKRTFSQSKATKRTVPTWPPSASKSKSNKKSPPQSNTTFHFSFSTRDSFPLLRPATFVAPKSSYTFSSTEFNSSQKTFSRPATFTAQKSSSTFSRTGFNSSEKSFSCGHSWRSSSIIKPATFIAPSDRSKKFM